LLVVDWTKFTASRCEISVRSTPETRLETIGRKQNAERGNETGNDRDEAREEKEDKAHKLYDTVCVEKRWVTELDQHPPKLQQMLRTRLELILAIVQQVVHRLSCQSFHALNHVGVDPERDA
jgi:hypothetical protein